LARTQLASTSTSVPMPMASEFRHCDAPPLLSSYLFFPEANMGAKNHTSVMPDANKNHAINSVVGAAFGAAGQRCMALSVAVLVGEAETWLPDIVEAAKQLKVGSGFDPTTDVGPMITPQALARAEDLIQSAIDQGATVDLDGRGCKPAGFENGNFLGPTVVSGVTPEMEIYKQEVFGPVLCVMKEPIQPQPRAHPSHQH
jgi:malonate-semialdehyde dehydrogenase (acetylating)/methylmalonate-semialdehyde dehydrogenase